MLIKNPKNMQKPLICSPISPEWKARIKANQWWCTEYEGSISDPLLLKNKTLISHILQFGGEEVCMPFVEEDIDKILNRGGLLYGENISFIKGRPSQCHENSSLIWNDNKSLIQIMTGYALSEDGMWRQHSWCIYKSDGQIIETTENRLAYFGFILTDEEAELFYFNNSF